MKISAPNDADETRHAEIVEEIAHMPDGPEKEAAKAIEESIRQILDLERQYASLRREAE